MLTIDLTGIRQNPLGTPSSGNPLIFWFPAGVIFLLLMVPLTYPEIAGVAINIQATKSPGRLKLKAMNSLFSKYLVSLAPLIEGNVKFGITWNMIE